MSRVLACAVAGCLLLAMGSSSGLAQEVRPRPNAAEAKIFAAFREPTSFDFVDQPWTDVVEFLSQHHKLPIQLDSRALSANGVGSDTPITDRFNGISLRSALRLMLDQADLTYVVRNEVLLITTRTEAENMLECRIYPVRDLVTRNSDLAVCGGDPRRGMGFGDDSQEDYAGLIELITTAVAPTTWDVVGGPGPTMDFSNSHAMAICQTADVHEEIAALFAALRLARDKQLKAATALAQVDKQRPQPAAPEPMQLRVYPLALPPVGRGGGFSAVSDDAPAAIKSGDNRIDKRAQEFAAILPEIIAPESWTPHGKGKAWTVGDRLIVRQSQTVHRKLVQLLAELTFGYGRVLDAPDQPLPRLAVPGPQTDWPQAAEPLPNEREAAIETALDARLDISFVDQPLSDVLAYIEREAKILVRLDSRALSDEGIGSDTPVTRHLHGLSLRAALRLMLSELELCYVVRDEVLLITTKTEAENMLQTKVYPVFDLVVRPADVPQRGPALDYAALVGLVQCNIAMGTWDETGGPGAIQEFANAGALVVSQTTEVHEELALFFRALREVGAEQQ